MTDLVWLLRAIEGVVLVVGALIATTSLRAWARTRNPALAFLGAGFVLVTVAAALAGVVYELVTHDLLSAWILSSALDGTGFALILYSILRPFSSANVVVPEAPENGPSTAEGPGPDRPSS